MFPTTMSLKVLGKYRAPDGWGALQWSTASLSPSMHLYSLCGDSSGKRTGSSTSTTCFFRCGTSWCSQSIAAVNTWYSSSIRSSSLRSSFTSCSLDKLENSSEAHTWPQTRMQRFTKHWVMKSKYWEPYKNHSRTKVGNTHNSDKSFIVVSSYTYYRFILQLKTLLLVSTSTAWNNY